MQTVQEALGVLKKNIKDAKPTGYWIKGSTYIFRLQYRGDIVGCNLYIVDGNKVTGTNPMLVDLDVEDMYKLK